MQRKTHQNHFAPGQLDLFMIQTEKAFTNVNQQCLVDICRFYTQKQWILTLTTLSSNVIIIIHLNYLYSLIIPKINNLITHTNFCPSMHSFKHRSCLFLFSTAFVLKPVTEFWMLESIRSLTLTCIFLHFVQILMPKLNYLQESGFKPVQ